MTDVPYFKPPVGDAEVARIAESVRSGWLTSGPVVREFEQRFAERVGADHAVALNSATAALHLSLVSEQVGPGDEVILPTLTFAAAAEVVLAVGATPVLVDSIPSTLAIDPAAVAAAVTERTRAIMPMHYGGAACDLGEILRIAASQPDIVVFDDAAHAFPARCPLGTIGSLTAGSSFSFYANKTITTGEGGMFTTNDEARAELVRQLSLHGLSRDAWKRFDTRSAWDYDIVRPGWKYNMTDAAASMGVVQLEAADEFAEQRRSIATAYDELLNDVEQLAPVESDRSSSACHLHVVRVLPTSRLSRNDVVRGLGEASIGSSVHYRPLHQHSYYRDEMGFSREDFPVAAAAFDQIVSLPIFPGLRRDQVERVASTLAELVSQ